MSTKGSPVVPPISDAAAVALNNVAVPFVKLMRYKVCAPAPLVRSAASAFTSLAPEMSKA